MRMPFLCAALSLVVPLTFAQKTDFNAHGAYEHLKVLAGEIGPRPMGSPAEHRAMEYAVARFREYGCQEAYIMPMTVTAGINTHSGVAIGVSKGLTGRIIIIGGHIDSEGPDVPGANDDGSGVACVLELARVIAGRPHQSTVVFCCWGGEEEGLRGSTYFTDHFPLLDSVALMLQIDMADGRGVLEVDPDGGFQVSAPRWLVRSAFEISHGEFGYDDAVYSTHSMTLNSAGRGSTGSDHEPFLEKGIPAIDFTSDVAYPIHTPLDNLRNFTPSGLQRSGDIVLRLFQKYDSGVPSRTTEKYYLLQFGGTPVFLGYGEIWAFLGLTVLISVAALLKARKRRPQINRTERIRWSGAKLLVSVVVIQAFVFLSSYLVGLIRGYRYPWVNNFNGFAALGIMAAFLGLWLMLRLSNRWRITVDAYVLFLRAFIVLLVYMTVMAIPGPELAIYPAFALLFLSLAMLVRVPVLKFVLAAIAPFMLLHLVFPEELGLYLRLFSEVPDEPLFTAIFHGSLTLVFVLLMLPFAFGFASVYRDAGVGLQWLNRFESGRGFAITALIMALLLVYQLTRPVYDDRWGREVRVEETYRLGTDSSALEIRSPEFLRGLKVEAGSRDTILQGRFTKFYPTVDKPGPVQWLTVSRSDFPLHDSLSTDSTVSLRRSVTLTSAIRPYIVEVAYFGQGILGARSAWSEGRRRRGFDQTLRSRVYTWYSFPDSVLTLPVDFTLRKGSSVTETVTVTYDTLSYPLRAEAPWTTVEYRTILSSTDTLRASDSTHTPTERLR